MQRFARRLRLSPSENFILFGPRQVGKSTFIREQLKPTLLIDLLIAENLIKYSQHPGLLREELRLLKAPALVVIDEIQKVPALLDSVHWLIENTALTFGLCGSSARKIKRHGGNMLGGRAYRYDMHGLVSGEIGPEFDLNRMLLHGYMPRAYVDNQPGRIHEAYVTTYLKEEILEEGATRNLQRFSDFLRVAALSDAEFINYSNIASDCGVSKDTARGYFEVLSDTLLGHMIYGYQKRAERRVKTGPKFYLHDIGLVNFLTRRSALAAGTPEYGKAFENWVFHELRTWISYHASSTTISYWRLSGGTEVDFVINDMEFAIEAKSSAVINNHHLKGLREVKRDYPKIKKRILVSSLDQSRLTDDGILVLSVKDFTTQLWSNELLSASK